MVLQLLAVFFLWQAVLGQDSGAFGYTESQLLTYIIGTSFVRSLVFSTRSTDVQAEISSGDLNNQIIKPFNYFGYWLSKDAADKFLNIIFSIIEIGLLVWIVQPPLAAPASAGHFAAFILLGLMAVLLYFFFSLIISLSTFWMPEGNGWPQRFFVYVILEFAAGGLFPLDILPDPVFRVVSNLPTAYMLHTPLQMYLGRIDISQLPLVVMTMVGWTVVFYLIAKYMFSRGLKIYGAWGR